ncbi:hypothetical protein ABT186_22360 [Streptomyces sp. NPDC001634]|uniref:hypothetical protein n=1 Tax=Streptomyces sp. NPDC001634 TaxID=3154390 RepID=UPI00331E6946
MADAGPIEAPGGDLHQFGFNGEVVALDQACTAVTPTTSELAREGGTPGGGSGQPGASAEPFERKMGQPTSVTQSCSPPTSRGPRR